MIHRVITAALISATGFTVALPFAPMPQPPTDAAVAGAKLQLKNGDRILLVGSSLLERDRHYGSLETLLRSRFPGVSFSVRNIAWPGDTTEIQLRPLNFERFEDTLRRHDASVYFVCYGSSEAFAGPAGIERFVVGYQRILDQLAASKPHTVVLLTPVRQENRGLPGVDPAKYNRNLKLYVEAIRRLADDRGHSYVDLFSTVVPEADQPPRQPLTANGVHLTALGYQKALAETARQLGLDFPAWQIEIDAVGGKISGCGRLRPEHRWSGGSSRRRRTVGQGDRPGRRPGVRPGPPAAAGDLR
jgi:hypothetical protein